MRFRAGPCNAYAYLRRLARSFGQNTRPLFCRKTAHEQEAVTFSTLRGGVIHEIRLDDNLVRRQSSFDELPAAKIVQRNISSDLVFVRADRPMQAEHPCQYGTLQLGLPIAPARDGSPRGMPDAIFADSPFKQKHRLRANQPEVMQGLNDRYAFPCYSPIYRWRDERECIVDMHDIRVPG